MTEPVSRLEQLIAQKHTPEARRTLSRDRRYLLLVDGGASVSEHGPTSYEDNHLRVSVFDLVEERCVLETTMYRYSSDGDEPVIGGDRNWGFSDDSKEFWVDSYAGTERRYTLKDGKLKKR